MRVLRVLRISTIITLLMASPVMASEWEWGVVPYLWASDMSVDVAVNDEPVTGADLDFSDILDKLDMALQLHVEGRRGRVGLFGDFTYLNTGDSVTLDAAPNLPGSTEVDTDAKTILFEAAGTFRPVDADTPFELIAGVRVISLDLDIDVAVPPPIGQSLAFDISDELIDVFAGARFMVPLSERFFFTLRGDIGTGDTDFSWNVQSTLGLQFGQRRQYVALLGYRHMEIDLEKKIDDVKVKTEMTMTGPMAGFMFRF